MKDKREIIIADMVYEIYQHASEFLLHFEVIDLHERWDKPVHVFIFNLEEIKKMMSEFVRYSDKYTDRLMIALLTEHLNNLRDGGETIHSGEFVALYRAIDESSIRGKMSDYYLLSNLSENFINKIRVPFKSFTTEENFASLSFIDSILSCSYIDMHSQPVRMPNFFYIDLYTAFTPRYDSPASLYDVFKIDIETRRDFELIPEQSILRANLLFQLENLPSTFNEIRQKLLVGAYFDDNIIGKDIGNRIEKGKKVRLRT